MESNWVDRSRLGGGGLWCSGAVGNSGEDAMEEKKGLKMRKRARDGDDD